MTPDAAADYAPRSPGKPIAIIGMAGRFPGGDDIEDFRRNLLEGVESISFFSQEELRAVGHLENEINDPAYVPAAPVIGDIDMFDASLFGMSAREAQLLDPQFRVFMEVCHAALEDGGVVPGRADTRVGLYAGAKDNAYLEDNVHRNGAVMRATGGLMAMINNHTDYLATTIAYRLGLTGPAVSLVTACSTSLVAIHTAARALRNGECEVALAGGVEIGVPEVGGYIYNEGGIYSPDGRVQTFDAGARGTVFGSGCGAVLLKPLDAALVDRNPIHGVLLGSAVNNDGNDKTGFFAPSKSGQVAVVRAALADAGVNPATIGYLEAHGTGTFVGDPIEVDALSTAYLEQTDKTGWCAVASIKANVGHLGAAAGVAGLVNAVLSVRDGLLAPVINVDEVNPRIDLERSPFHLNQEPRSWSAADGPRRAGVSSFGIGGTNANAIVEQPPERGPSPAPRRGTQLVPLAAHTPEALDALTEQLAAHVARRPGELADIAYTLSTGRRHLPLRRVAVLSADDADSTRIHADLPSFAAQSGRTVTFLFPGQGAQHPNMAAELYDFVTEFREEIDACAQVLRVSHGLDLIDLLFHADAETQNQTRLTQPVLFAVEYALAKTLRGMGVEPAAMAGHSSGEYVAATLAGVFTRDDALRLVAERGRLMQSVETGAMLALTLSEELLVPMLPPGVDLAAVNAPGVCVVAGGHDDIRQFEDDLTMQGIGCRPVRTSHAFHSRTMDGILESFEEAVRATARSKPSIPFVSNLTGTWISDDEATDPSYWARHLRGCVRFSDAVHLLTADGERAFLEVGPGRTLAGYVTAHDRAAVAITTMRAPKQQVSEMEALLSAVGRAWAHGVAVDWERYWGDEQRSLVSLPAYPFQRQRYWIDPDPETPAIGGDTAVSPIRVGAYTTPVWLETPAPAQTATDCVWIILGRSGDPYVTEVAALAEQAGAKTVVVHSTADAMTAVTALEPHERERVKLVHCLLLGERPEGNSEAEYAQEWLERGFFSALSWLQGAVRELPSVPFELVLVSSQMQDVLGDGAVEPAKAAILGLVKLIPKELESVGCRSIDFGARNQRGAQLVAEIASGRTEQQVAYRGRKRWAWSFAGLPAEAPDGVPARLKQGGVYLVTGGLGGLGLALARQLASLASAKVVLLGRTGLPERNRWTRILSEDPDSWQARRISAVQEVEATGGRALVLAADVTDETRMREVRDLVLDEFGPVDGVFHLAAVAGGGMLDTRTREEAASVFAPKVRGTYLLDEIFAPELVVLYSSIAVLSGDFGLGDYVGANAVLDAFAQARWAEGRYTVSVNWPPFAEVGMAHEVDAPSVLSDVAWGRENHSADSHQVGHPMLRTRSNVDDELTVFELDLSPANWFLAEHKLGGTPTMPGTGHVELIRAGFAEVTGRQCAELSDLTFLQPLTVRSGTRAQLELRRRADGRFDATVREPEGAELVRGIIGEPSEDEPVKYDLDELRTRLQPIAAPDFADLGILSFGPRWTESITGRHSGPDTELVTVQLADRFHSDLENHVLHPAVLDCSVSIGQIILDEGAYLPFSCGTIRIHSPLTGRVHSLIRHRNDTGGEASAWDIALADDDGNELVAIEAFTLCRMPPEAAAQARRSGSPPDVGEPAGEVVLAKEGGEALRRILAADLGPQVIWCPEGLDVRLARTSRVVRSAVTEHLTALPAGSGAARTLVTPYVEPITDLEKALAGLWSETLGVEQIGAEDDFFDLGGNSLFSVQLVARINQNFDVDVSAALLFDSRDVRTLAAAIESRLVAKVAELSEDEARQALSELGQGDAE